MRDMKYLPVISTLVAILIICMVLVTGCLDGERDGAMSRVTPTPSATIPPSIYWIKIDPISDKQIDEIFIINATTNLSAGDEIQVKVYSTHFKPTELGSSGKFSGCAQPIKVIPGRNGTNTISYIVNSAECNLVPDEYQITEDAFYLDSNGRVQSNAIGEARFNITPGKTS